MAILLHDGSNHNGVFDLIGSLAASVADVNALRGGAATSDVLSAANLVTRLNTLEGWYGNGSLRQIVENVGAYSNLTAFQAAQSAWISNLAQKLSVQTLIAMASVDQGQSTNAPAAQLVGTGDPTAALQYIIAQMTAASTSVNSSTPSLGSQTNVGSPTGNPIIVGSTKNPQGAALQYLYPETMTFTCTKDAASGATAGQEQLTATGQTAVTTGGAPDVFSQLWPGGSGALKNYTLCNAALNNPSGNNLLTNGDFTAFNTSYPNNWNTIVGVAGTDFLNGGTGNAYTPGGAGGSLQIVGDGSTLPTLRQPFNTAASTVNGAGGTPAVLKGNNVVAVNFWIKTSSAPAAGVLRVALVDSTGAVINDDAGNANSFTQSLTGVSTSFVNVNGVFRLPANINAVSGPISLELKTTTAITAAHSLYIGRLGAVLMAPAYPSGPLFAAFSANTNPTAAGTPDAWTFAVGNTWGVLQKWLFRIFNAQLAALGIQFPNSGSPTVPDSVVA